MTGGAALVLSEFGPTMVDPDGPAVPDDGRDGSCYRGVVVKVDARSLTDVRSFTIRQGDKTFGEMFFDFQIGELENADEFPPSHLLEHQATAEAVRVFYHEEDGVRFATR